MKQRTKHNIVFLIALGLSLNLLAQKPLQYQSPEYDFNFALELMQKEQYGAAAQHFKEVYEDKATSDELRINSYYYMGVCAITLEHQDAGFLLRNYIRNYPVHSNVKKAHFHLGKYYFSQKKYKQSLEEFNEIDERDVPAESLTEYRFKKGYDYFFIKDYDEAKAYFKTARKDTTSSFYKTQAIYYNAHIAYNDEQYEAALEDFLLLKDESAYEGTVPFYIAQIYFLQKKYDKAVEIAVPLLDKAENKSEMNRIIALSYYNLGNYEKAMPYFENYLSQAKTQVTPDDEYAIGYTYYENKEYEKAITHLASVTRAKDATAQNAFYIIGDCYLKTGNNNLSMQSFLEASKLDFSEEIKEDAMYNYAKLQYETSGNAFNSAIKALEQYVNTYPHTTRGEEAMSYLSDIYMSTKNYQGAITSLEKITSKSPQLLAAYQRCTHYRALELINNKNYKGALQLIEKSMNYPKDHAIQTSNLYWKAESEYRSGEYLKSYYSFQSYYKNAYAKSDENYANSYYSYGYAALKSKKYAEAETGFKTYLTQKELAPELEADALARLADSYYMRKDLNSALTYYVQCSDKQSNNFDYALYQQAKCYGYLNKHSKKLEALERLQTECPRSTYLDDAEYEIATTYHAQNDYAMAITSYKLFIAKHPKSPYIRQAYNKLAQAYLNTQETDAAITNFKYVFEHYQGSTEAKDALSNLQTIYAETGEMGEFFTYIKNKGNIDIKTEEQDSITYKAALTKYNRGDCESAIKGFNDYVKLFPKGFFVAEAYYHKAECEYGMKDYENALSDYEALLTHKNSSQYDETAIRRSAIILYNKKEYAKSLERFTQLSEIASSSTDIILSHSGIMRSAYELKNHTTAKKSAEFLLLQDNTDNELRTEARYIAGKSAYALSDFVAAKKYLGNLAKSSTNDAAAEAAYITALIEFQQNNLDECEKIINDILSSNYSSEYWYASTFILYGDWYLAKGNVFQAKHTYQSIVDNYEGADLKEIAQQKIDKIVAAEEEEKKAQEQEIELENNNE
ncbi:MAG: tetratricopeptide repeat protein [Bacteroidales bacterium]|nr:tetratricopeptide repeat protein [Bacteroidales bacterium]